MSLEMSKISKKATHHISEHTIGAKTVKTMGAEDQVLNLGDKCFAEKQLPYAMKAYEVIQDHERLDRVGYEFMKIGLYLPPEKLKKKIEQRLLARIRMGMLNEARKLHKKGLSWKRMEELGLEYKFMALHLQNKISRQEMLEQLNTAIYQYGKRQMTWFKRDKKIKWFDASKKINLERII